LESVESMKPRKLKLVAMVSGFATNIAEVHIQNFASEPELKDWTELVCPVCLKPTKYHGASYECETCEGHPTFSWWGKLLRVVKGTTSKVEMPRLLKEKETAVGQLFKMKRSEFAKYVDATKAERGVTVEDKGSAHNLFKLLVATRKLEYVIIATYKDTTEEVVALLTLSESGRIILKEIIPVNLARMKATLVLDSSEITEQDVQEAGQFLSAFIPEATEKTLTVSDYRTQWMESHLEPEEEEDKNRVVAIKEIIAKAKA
jgi:hypothetical protein